MRTLTILTLLICGCSDGGPVKPAAFGGALADAGEWHAGSGGLAGSAGGASGEGGSSGAGWLDASIDSRDGDASSDGGAGSGGHGDEGAGVDSGTACADFEEPYGDGCDRVLWFLEHERTLLGVDARQMHASLQLVGDTYVVVIPEPNAAVDAGPVVTEAERSDLPREGVIFLDPTSGVGLAEYLEGLEAPVALYAKMTIFVSTDDGFGGYDDAANSQPKDVYVAGKTITRLRYTGELKTVAGQSVATTRWELRGF